MLENNKPILFFDGHCNLCNGFIDFLVKTDKRGKIQIASLQGETAKNLLPPDKVAELSSVVLRDEGGQLHTQSDAIFYVARAVKGKLSLLLPFQILPKALTDWIYVKVAQNRYRMFGRKDTCRIPTEEEKSHFLP